MKSTTRGIEVFWTWFVANAARVRRSGPGTADVPAEITAQLHRIAPQLAWEITPSKVGDWQLVVSADGNRELFPLVHAVVAAAPSVPGFRVKAFRQRGSTEGTIQYRGGKLAPSDIRFSAEPRGADAIAVTLFIRGLSDDNDETLSGAAVLLLDDLLGEYDAITKIAELKRSPLPSDAAGLGLRPFAELRSVVDALGRRR